MTLQDSAEMTERVARALRRATGRITIVKRTPTGKLRLEVPGVGYFRTCNIYKHGTWTFYEAGGGEVSRVETMADCLQIIRETARAKRI